MLKPVSRPFAAVAGLMLLLSSCGPGSAAAVPPAPPAGRGASPAPSAPGPGARAVAERLRAVGGLRVATSRSETIYEPRPDGGYDGFMMRLAAAFAAWLEVPLLVEEVRFEDLFKVGGAVLKEATPAGARADLFSRVDLYVHALSPLPWREAMMRLVPVIPNRIVAVSRRGEAIGAVADLAGKRVVVQSATSFESLADRLSSRVGTGFDILRVADEAEPWEAIAGGRADLTFDDSSSVIRTMAARAGLVVGAPLSDLENLCWAVGPDDLPLARALEEFLAGARADGSLDRVWRAYYGISLADYYGLLRYAPPASLALSAEERAWVEEARRRGGLRVAIDTELTIYEPRADGSAGGLHLALARRLAASLGLPLVITPVRFDQFFSLRGAVPARAKTDPSFRYTPDLLKSVDLYVASLSPLAWRKRFLAFTGIFPTCLVYLHPASRPIRGPGDFDGRRIALLPNTSYEDWLAANAGGRDLGIVLASSGEETAVMVADGRADFALFDANLALAQLRAHPGLRMSPASSEVDTISWAVARENRVLSGILGAWVAAIRKDGSFEAEWADYYHASFAEYLGMISAGR